MLKLRGQISQRAILPLSEVGLPPDASQDDVDDWMAAHGVVGAFPSVARSVVGIALSGEVRSSPTTRASSLTVKPQAFNLSDPGSTPGGPTTEEDHMNGHTATRVARRFAAYTQILPALDVLPAPEDPAGDLAEIKTAGVVMSVWFVLTLAALAAAGAEITAHGDTVVFRVAVLAGIILATTPQVLVLYFRWRGRRAR